MIIGTAPKFPHGSQTVHVFHHSTTWWERRLLCFGRRMNLLGEQLVVSGNYRVFKPSIDERFYMFVGNRCRGLSRAKLPPMEALYAEWVLTR